MAAAMIETELFGKYGQSADIQLVAPAMFVVTVRTGTSVHVVAGSARECVAKLGG